MAIRSRFAASLERLRPAPSPDSAQGDFARSFISGLPQVVSSPATMPLSFDQLISLLDQPPFEPCDSELRYFTRVQYDRAFTEAVRLHYRGVKHLIVHLTRSWAVAEDLTQEVFTNVYRAARNAVYTESRRARRDHIMRLRLAGLSPFRSEKEVRDMRPLQDAELLKRATSARASSGCTGGQYVSRRAARCTRRSLSSTSSGTTAFIKSETRTMNRPCPAPRIDLSSGRYSLQHCHPLRPSSCSRDTLRSLQSNLQPIRQGDTAMKRTTIVLASAILLVFVSLQFNVSQAGRRLRL
jgi:hypothetical protein